MTTQAEHRRSVTVGPHLDKVSPVSYWYKHGHFANDAEAKGAFKLAYQQALDGMGESIPQWMGLSEAEFNAWHCSETLPQR